MVSLFLVLFMYLLFTLSKLLSLRYEMHDQLKQFGIPSTVILDAAVGWVLLMWSLQPRCFDYKPFPEHCHLMSAQRVCLYVLGDVKFLTIFSFFIGSLKAADLLQLMKNTNLPRNLLLYTIVFFFLECWFIFFGTVALLVSRYKLQNQYLYHIC